MTFIKRYASLILVALIALGAGIALRHFERTPTAPTADAATKLAQLTLPDLDGKPSPLQQWRGKKWVVNFWATWCAPCREEMPMLAALSKAHEGKVQFLGIGIDSPEEMKKFIQETPVPYPLLVGGNEVITLSAELGNKAMALPFTVVLDEKGAVIWQHLGKVAEAELARVIGP
ncbi:MAG: hypothetical protein RIR70_1884 [Pseudomonadota bacterium]